MDREKQINQKNKQESKEYIKPSDIKGKIEVPDKRERKDGPGGN